MWFLSFIFGVYDGLSQVNLVGCLKWFLSFVSSGFGQLSQMDLVGCLIWTCSFVEGTFEKKMSRKKNPEKNESEEKTNLKKSDKLRKKK